MALWDGIKRQLRSVIEWENINDNELFYQWSENGDEIKNASKLIVGPGQGCIFVYEGKVTAVVEEEGIVNLETSNVPFWTTITKIMQAFESEHKVGLYFYKRTRILDQKWGTLSSIKYDDPKYNFPVALRVFGNYSIQISDAKLFFTQVVGGDEIFRVSKLRDVMVNRLIHPLTDYLAEKKLSYAEVDAKRNEIAKDLTSILQSDFDRLGFKLIDFRIEGTEFDEDTITRINKIADVSADMHAASTAGVSYRELQQLDALKDAAKNEAGAAGVFMGMGAGNALSQTMNEPFAKNEQKSKDLGMRLRELKSFYSEGLISEDEYSLKKKSILQEL
ncbi:SPFH domain-containing protein [Sulfurimonas sp.]|uniref:SPFH domain-containing protein n=1 Tax=Sulfurimonas sp. TaxID=2022749 RepID=UPI002B462026|nr:SPFH domain-containing protein [Sulfurimonas sp.]